jgi:hypothetical protein
VRRDRRPVSDGGFGHLYALQGPVLVFLDCDRPVRDTGLDPLAFALDDAQLFTNKNLTNTRGLR